MCISPLFEYLLITKGMPRPSSCPSHTDLAGRPVSGVPMLEKKMDDELGNDDNYKAYKDRTPVFFPNIFRG